MITPARKHNLYEEVAKQIIQMINDGIWKPDEKILGEIELARQFEVSRNSIRESIKALELIGILESRTGIGTFVSTNAMVNINNMDLTNLIETESSLVEIFETRLIIEPGLMYLAAKNATSKDVEALYEIIDRSKKAIMSNAYTFNLGFEFHRYIFNLSGNKILINLMESITESLIMTRHSVFYKHLNEHIISYELEEHSAMVECIKKNDAMTAKNLMYRHIENSLNIAKSSAMNE